MRSSPPARLGEMRDVIGETWDVVVAGAGPAGSTIAALLADRGLGTLLVDRANFPRNKVCGCCLNGAALEAFRQSGAGAVPRQLEAVPLRDLELTGYGRRLRIPLPGGCVLSRSRLDLGLAANAVERGARLLQNTVATLGEEERGGWRIELLDKGEGAARGIFARVVVCADGLDGGFLKHHAAYAPVISPRSRIGLGQLAATGSAGPEPGRIRMAVGPEGYVGMVRLEDGQIDLAAAVDRAAIRKGGPSDVIARILEGSGERDVADFPDGIRGTPALTRRRASRAGTRLFLLGDAAGYVEPFTGEGIAWAVSSSVLAAPIVARACRGWDPALSREWEARYQRRIGRRQAVIRLLALLLRRPTLSRVAVSVLCGLPISVRPVVTSVNRPVVER